VTKHEREQQARSGPSSLPRQQRRQIDRQFRKLVDRDVCSFCSGGFKHNTRTVGGFDAQGNVALAGECCRYQVATIFVLGVVGDRKYDFLLPRGTKATEPTSEQIDEAIGVVQKAIADVDKRLDGVERRGGVERAPQVNVLDYPWKSDDCDWFDQNRERSHRVRMPFPGECDEVAAKAPVKHALIVLVRQVEPGNRLKIGFFLNAALLPVPDDEAVAHALFDVATQREPVPPRDRATLIALIEARRTSTTRS
jgi:hypothetical protein